MRKMLLAGLAAGLCAVVGGAKPAAAVDLSTSIDLDYTYSQVNVGGDVDAVTQYNQKYEIKYTTALTTAYDFLGAVRVELQDAWHTDQATTSHVAPTLEMSASGALASAKIVYDAASSTSDAYLETETRTSYSSGLSFNLEMTPVFWPEVKLKYQRRRDFLDYSREGTTSTYELSARKDIYGVRLEYNFKREDIDKALPTREGSTGTTWSGKATYQEILWGGAEFELAYEINEEYSDKNTRGVFTGETSKYTQLLRTRLKNSLVIAPRITLGLSWEYQFDQDLLTLDYDYKLKNKYALDLRWDAYDDLKINGGARRETDLTAALVGVDDDRTVTDTLNAGFDYTAISWLRVSGKAEFTSEGKIVANTGASVDKVEQARYELIAKNRIGEFWDFTVNASTSSTHTNDFLTNRETRVKADLLLKLLGVDVRPSYEVSRINKWEEPFEFPTEQEQVRDAKIRFEYQMQLLDMFHATFSHEYTYKVDDKLDNVLNFERVLQFSEDTRLSIALAEIVRDVTVEGEIDRKASDIEDDPDPELIELSYGLKLTWTLEQLSVYSSINYNDKGDTFDDVSFNARASWKGERLEVSGEYQYDKIIKDATEPKDEKRKLNLRLNYKF